MKNSFLIFCFLCFGSVFSQNLENAIYDATDAFNAEKTEIALAELNQNISAYESKLSSIDEYMAFIHLLVNKAYYLDKQSQNNKAISTYEKAWRLYKEQEIATEYQYDIIENCMKPLGTLYNRVGDYTSAENIIKNFSALAEKTNDNKQRIAGATNLSRLYQTIGRHEDAIAIANYGLNLKNLNSQQKNRLKGIKARSEVRLNQKVIVIDKVIVGSNWLPDDLENKELAYELAMQKKDYPLALKVFKSLKNLKKDKLSSASVLAKLYFQEAQLYYLLNEIETANKSLKIALKPLLPDYDAYTIPKEENLYPENTFIDLFDLAAALQTDPKKALEYYNLSFYVSDLLSQNTTSQEGKIILLNEKRNRSEKCLELLYTLQNTSDNSAHTIEALRLSERYKSTVLKEITGKKELLKLYPNDTLLKLQQKLNKEQELLTNRLIKTPFNATFEQRNNIREQLSIVNIDLKKLNASINSKYGVSKDSINISTLQLKLEEDNATLVEYFYGKNAIYQIVLSEKNIDFKKIVLDSTSTQSIKNFINYFDSPSAINNKISNFTTEAFQLFNLLHLNELQNNKNLIIIPDGLLNFVPFDALLTQKTESKKFETMPFFLKTHNTVFNSSVSFYLSEKISQKNPKVLGVFPVFKDSNLKLTYSIDEAKSLEIEIETTLLMDDKATKATFLKEARNYSILHLSTHGKSGNFFEPAQIAFTDEPLSINELYAINLNSDLVVLSACETGVGVLQRGEGAMSIARGFQYAGAKRVLYSLWQISDLSTSQIMASFYENLDNSKSVSFANHQSKLDYLNNSEIKNLKKSPYYWSAFTLYGDFDKAENSSLNMWLIIGVSLILTLFLLWLFKQKNGKQTLGISS